MLTVELPAFPKRTLLSARQLQIAGYIVHGYTNKETARELNISPRTVEDHRKNLMQKLGTRNSALLAMHIFGSQVRP